MFKIYFVAIYLLTVRSTVLDEDKNILTNVDLEKNDLAVDEDSLSDDEHTDSSISTYESENGEQIDLVKYENLFKIISSLVEKKLLTQEEINTMFCLDLNLGSEWRKEILERLEGCFKNNDFNLGCFFLQSCLKRLRENNLSQCYDDCLPKNISFEVNENIKLDNFQQKRLRVIVNELYYYSAGENTIIRNFQNNLKVIINPLEKDYHKKDLHLLNVHNVIVAFINYEYPRILLSKRPIMFLGTELICSRFNPQTSLSENVDDNDQQNRLSTSVLDTLSEDKKPIIVHSEEIESYLKFLHDQEKNICRLIEQLIFQE